jgi:hypothetical protein
MNPVNRGRLKNGNQGGDPNLAPRCGAKNRRGTLCQAPAIRGRRRCRLHGGWSRGPVTVGGLERSRRARWTHGQRSREAIERRREHRKAWRELLALLTEDCSERMPETLK